MSETMVCPYCSTEKPVAEFTQALRPKNREGQRCDTCMAASRTARTRKRRHDPEKRERDRVFARAWKDANRDRNRARDRAYARARRVDTAAFPRSQRPEGDS